MGHPVEVDVDSFPDCDKRGDETAIKEDEFKHSNHSQRSYEPERDEPDNDNDDDDDNSDVLDFLYLVEKSRLSKEIKKLLLKILMANKSDELKHFLADSETTISFDQKKKQGSGDADTRNRRKSKRTSIRSGRADKVSSSGTEKESISSSRSLRSDVVPPSPSERELITSSRSLQSDALTSSGSERESMSSSRSLRSDINPSSGSQRELISSSRSLRSDITPSSGSQRELISSSRSLRSDILASSGSQRELMSSSRSLRSDILPSSGSQRELMSSSRPLRSDKLPSSGSQKELVRSSSSKNVRRRSLKSLNVDRSDLLTTLYDATPSPKSERKIRTRLSDNSLRKQRRLPEHPKLSSSLSMNQMRSYRRTGEPIRRQYSVLDTSKTTSGGQNASWDLKPSTVGNGRRRLSTPMNLLKHDLLSTGNRSRNFDTFTSLKEEDEDSTRQSNISVRKMHSIVVKNEKKKKKKKEKDGDDDGVHVAIKKGKSTALVEGKVESNTEVQGESEANAPVEGKAKTTAPVSGKTFAQFEETGDVSFRKTTEGLHDLLDDLRLLRDSNSSIEYTADEAEKEEKKGIRSFLKLTKQKVSFNSNESSEGERDSGKDQDDSIRTTHLPSYAPSLKSH